MKIKPFNEKLAQLTRILSNGQYHDGNMLGHMLHITRSAVWKMIKKFESYDVNIDSIQSNGYALKEPLIMLEPNLIKSAFADDINVTVLESVPSTNAYFQSVDNFQTKKIHCCFSEHQTQGRGRLNRSWVSPFGKNIYLSCYYPFQKDLSELAGLSLVISLAVIEALRELGLTSGCAKWPNDVLYNGKKIAGILMDVHAESHGFCKVIIGIGLNVNMTMDDQPDIAQAWTSVREESNKLWDRNEVAIILLRQLLQFIQRFEQEGFSVFSEAWDAVDWLRHKMITLDYKQDLVVGTVVGINPNGNILLRFTNGDVKAFSSGDARLLKI